MKILHITGEYPPYIQGGLGTYTKEITLSQANSGHEVSVLVLSGDLKDYQHNSEKISSKLNVFFRAFVASDFDSLDKTFLSSRAVIEKFQLEDFILFSPDIIHVHDWYGAIWGVALKFATNAKLIFTSHLPIRAGFTYTGHAISVKQKMQLEALAMRVADKILAPSDSVLNILASEYNVSYEKMMTVPNGINLDIFQKISAAKKTELSLISVSRLSEQKGLFYLLDVIAAIKKKLPKVKCVVVGEGPIKKTLQTEIKRLDLVDNVQLVGYKSHEELSSLYTESSLFVGTSIYEPFGLVILEALASGLPVVAFSVGGIKDILAKNKVGFLINPGDTEAMAECILMMFNNQKILNSYSKAAVKHAKKFDWQLISQRIEKVYSELCKKD